MKLREWIKRLSIRRAIRRGRLPRGRYWPNPLKNQKGLKRRLFFQRIRLMLFLLWIGLMTRMAKENAIVFVGKLYLKFKPAKSDEWVNLGLVAVRVVTTAGVNYLVDCFQNSTGSPMDVFKYHDSGTGTNAESSSDTALQTPCGESRDAGSQAEGSSANIYKTVATHQYSGSFAITEHGLFSAASAGTLWDRSVFSAINVGNGDSIQFTYELTCNAGG
jgi:hypothetical protein